MKMYEVLTLTPATPALDQTKLTTALKAVHGVETVILHPKSNKFEIQARDKQEPKRASIAAAAAGAGFEVTPKKK